MIPGTLTDLDPPPARERRWPFYVAWTVGGVLVGAALASHVPVSLNHPAGALVAEPASTPAPLATTRPTVPPAGPRILILPPPGSPLRVAPAAVEVVPARP
jgi:hypothetical protein